MAHSVSDDIAAARGSRPTLTLSPRRPAPLVTRTAVRSVTVPTSPPPSDLGEPAAPDSDSPMLSGYFAAYQARRHLAEALALLRGDEPLDAVA